jgi:hypothetical protein
MKGFPISALVAIGFGAGFAILANMLALIIVGEINQKVPEDRQVSYFWHGSTIRKQHRLFYPESKLVLFLDLCTVLLISRFVLAVFFMRLS